MSEIFQLVDENTPKDIPTLQFMALTTANDAIQIHVRKQLGTAIETRRLASGFLFNSFTIQETWLPRENYKELAKNHPEGKVYLSCKAISEGAQLGRGTPVVNREFQIMLGYQKAGVSADSVSEIDTLVSFIDQLYEECRKLNSDTEGEAFQFVRNDAQVDENNLPYDFAALQSHSLFEVYWDAVYLTIMSP